MTADDLGLTPPPKNGPAVLIYDIECTPSLGWGWPGRHPVEMFAVEQDWYLLSFAYKWLNKATLRFVSIFQDEEFYPDTTNDLHVTERLHALFDRADILVAHNGDRFDERKGNARFLHHGMSPPAPSQTIDTLKEHRRYFNEHSHSLKEIGRRNDLGGKTPHTGWGLWRACMAGDAKAWRLMERYNRRDVTLLEGVYLKIRPWIGSPGKKAHPNMGFWADGNKVVCTNCGSDKLQSRGVMRTNALEYRRFHCQTCGHWNKAPKADVTSIRPGMR